MADLQSTGALADDPLGGLLTADFGLVYYLTRCCGASGKGSANSSTGTVCRACYREVSAEFGRGWRVDDEAAWERYRERLAAELGEHLATRLTQRVKTAAHARVGERQR